MDFWENGFQSKQVVYLLESLGMNILLKIWNDVEIKCKSCKIMQKLLLNSFKQARYRPLKSSLFSKADLCQEHTVNNKKTHTPCFSTLRFPVYLRNHLSYKNLFPSFCISFWRALSWNKTFSNPMKQSADIGGKNVNFPIKS